MMTLDEVDIKLLEYYSKDHRIRASALSPILGVSRETIRARTRKLIDNNLLRGYVSIVDPRGLGLNVLAFYFLKTNPHEPWLLDKIKMLPNCDFIAGLTGRYSLLSRYRLLNEDTFGKMVYKVDSLMAQSGSRTYRVVRVVDVFKENGFIVETIPKRIADTTDITLLKLIVNQKCSESQYSPISTPKLALEMGMSQPAVYKRLKRLETDHILLGFGVDVNWADIYGNWIGFVLQIKVAFDKINEVAQMIANFSEVQSLYRTTEEYLLLGLIWTRGVDEFNKLLWKCYTIPGVEDTKSLLMLDVPLKRSPVNLLTASRK